MTQLVNNAEPTACGCGDTHAAASGGTVATVNAALDGAVGTVHRLLPGRYHPYFLTEDLACLGSIAVGFAYQASFGRLDASLHAAILTLTFLAYGLVYLRLKRRITGLGARSTMQDSLVFVIPLYLGLSWACGQDRNGALDMLAFSLLIAVGLMRVGCFIGGCCHGRPSRLGVFYPRHVLREVSGLRLYSSGPYSGQRVFPLQLVGSAGCLAIAAGLWLRLSAMPQSDGSTLPLAVVCYAALRFTLEFFRGHRHRPMHLGLSEAQWLSLAILLGAASTLVI